MARTFNVTCEGCGRRFKAGSPRAKWHSPGCKKQAQRTGRKVGQAKEAESEPSGLVASVRKELADANALDTFAGQLALQLAQRLSTPAESGISSLSKELRTVMASALEGRTPPSAQGEPEEDEVEKARRRRVEKARAAAG